MRLNKLIIVIAIIFPLAINAQKKERNYVNIVKSNTLENATESSLSYTLPQTVIKVDIECVQTIKKAGPFYRYSERYLNLKNVITKDSEDWTISDIKVSTFGIPNPGQRYNIKSQGNNIASLINLTSTGILAGFNTDFTEKEQKVFNTKIPLISDINFDDIPYNSELLYKTSTAAMAQEAANVIYKLRKSRLELIMGEMENLPPDGTAYNRILEQINKMEAQFLSLFIGKTVKTKVHKTIEFVPNPLESYKNHVICRFSTKKGIISSNDISGTPIYAKLNTINRPLLPNKKTEKPDKNSTSGLYYYIPATINFAIFDKNIELLNLPVQIAQYGQVVSMSTDILKKKDVSIKINTATGALIEIIKTK